VRGEARPADRVDPSVYAVQKSSSHPLTNPAGTERKGLELRERDDSMLPLGQLCDFAVDRPVPPIARAFLYFRD